jgi:hypothetical protein
MVEPAKVAQSSQRIDVQLERHSDGKRVKIRVENFDEKLGWYTSGSLMLPLNQLPLLEQAVEEMRSESTDDEFAKIIPFPGMISAA